MQPPWTNWSATKSSDQRSFALRGTTIGARVPRARSTSAPTAHHEALLAIAAEQAFLGHLQNLDNRGIRKAARG
jgi:hypothetical protein